MHLKMKAIYFLFLYIHVKNVITICPDDFEEVGSQCYLFLETPMTWEDANSFCKGLDVAHSQNIDLAMMDISVAENQNFLTAVKSKVSAFWIGGTNHQGQEHWFWNDGREISHTANYWYLHEPAISNEVPGCTMANYTKGTIVDRVYLYSENCTTQLPYICQSQDICPHGFQRIGMSCYFFSFDNGAPMLTWQSARDFCLTIEIQSGQTDLAVLGLDEEIDTELLKIIGAKGKGIWLGAYLIGNDTWTWIDGRHLSLDSYFWAYGEPNDLRGNAALHGWIHGNQATIADHHPGEYEMHYLCQVM
ncbi:unnamed protein product, partial [Meganyctiphanes norvegica]